LEQFRKKNAKSSVLSALPFSPGGYTKPAAAYEVALQKEILKLQKKKKRKPDDVLFLSLLTDEQKQQHFP
jgi:hypothetical protein